MHFEPLRRGFDLAISVAPNGPLIAMPAVL